MSILIVSLRQNLTHHLPTQLHTPHLPEYLPLSSKSDLYIGILDQNSDSSLPSKYPLKNYAFNSVYVILRVSCLGTAQRM
ncbi:hypothetical protein [Hafnia phage yong3]|nr:hypothetical protein [Hafnia phage yong3]